jgi:hypothetical protein
MMISVIIGVLLVVAGIAIVLCHAIPREYDGSEEPWLEVDEDEEPDPRDFAS